ncbi:E3 ubiquitin-protein ligase At3g02290 [Ziziphus jujuba]|nr:E3 ubiquitin-protein ligase At3g02290 [Ziziphus jujuba]XP_015898250.2 E3 ubiquitin-protein ligase At3g02290 [Ziziphus jujuba]XP_015898251.2 E3 ubiquitin-protein ligase At3g02290 [Ziziphus jujuba]XP_024922328.2 E3 ubiquitin-protein ligase At3g02290 [Ziziphus jujuba]XP_024922329.2 E3 ubiquitin-protein ligase At3g02290-like [Ziziphus jujuba var. spinosa]
MGALCCCPCGDEFDEYALPSNPMHRHCICLRFFLHQLFSGYGAMFQRLDARSVSSPVHGANVLASSAISPTLSENSSSDSQISVSRPLAYDNDQRYSRSQRDGLVSRRDKSLTHLQEDSQLRRNMSSSGIESLGFGKKWNGVDAEEDCKVCHSESSEKALATKVACGLTYTQPSSEDEDVCPTCLDEYTPENPKITTRCSHHFHLGCIYEWLERSESCPICGQEMEFCESP